MPEPIKLRLADIPEDLKDNSTKGQLAAAVREGRRRERSDQAELNAKLDGQHKGHVEGVKAAHVEELNRSGHVLAVGNRWRGRFEGAVIGGALMLAAGAVLLGQ